MTKYLLVVVYSLAALAAETGIQRSVRAGDLAQLRARIEAGEDVNARDASGRTALIEAAELGRTEAAQVLIAAGADLEASPRGWGTALEVAERSGHAEVATLLRKAGARTWGRSVGDKVCVRPWKGDGYCGMVESVEKNTYRIRVTDVVGCVGGCEGNAECSGGNRAGVLRPGDVVTTVSWCLTHTGVRK